MSSVYKEVARMVRAGYRREQIAEALGVSEAAVNSARRYANTLGMDLPRFPRKYPTTLAAELSNQQACAALHAEAKIRGVSPGRLAGRILTAVLKDNLVTAVLDE